MKIKTAIIVMICSFAVVPVMTSGQEFLEFGDATELDLPTRIEVLNIETSPEYPRPGQEYLVRASNFSVDLSRVNIRWTVDGRLFESGSGITEITLTAGKTGSATRINVSATPTNGATIRGSKTVRPSSVDIYWETDSYTPPFYRGKALYPNQGLVKFVAIPHVTDSNGKRIDPKKLVYTWSQGSIVDGQASGYGKQTYTTEGPLLLRDIELNLRVESVGKSFGAQTSIQLKPINSQVLLYEDHPLYGIRFEQALNRSLPLRGNEIRVAAIPFFFETLNRLTDTLDFAWTVNGESIDSSNRSNMVFRKSSDASGQSNVGIEVKHRNKVFQNAKAMATFVLSGTNIFNPNQ